jgi:NitT/TauT family transport system permease protein
MSRRRDYAHSLAFLFAILVLWQGVVTLFSIPKFLLPGLPDILQAYMDNTTLLASGLVVTSLEILVSFTLSAAIGVLAGTCIAKSPLLGRTVFPLLVIGQSVPVLAAAPLFVVWFGFGYTPKILIAVLITFFPIMMGTVLGLRSTDPDVLSVARSMGFKTIAKFIKIELPGALPLVFGGLKIAGTLVVVGVVVGEFVGSSAGLGYVLLRAAGTINTPLLFASLGLLIALGVMISALINLVERRVSPWRFEAS